MPGEFRVLAGPQDAQRGSKDVRAQGARRSPGDFVAVGIAW